MAAAIMIQGTASNSGKSLVAAGLCRIFSQDGYSVAPFKSQNMALNSYITGEGLEMGRAQVMQAEAAGVEPSVLMNPILLKPTNDVGSQVIVGGEVVGQMSAAEYFSYKRRLRPVVRQAYDELASLHDIIVIEGAGSPAEINLMQEDIVNMGMAELAGAPVLLVGDIDRGGVFASLYGTIALLPEPDRGRICGLIINKFRGDVEILRPGLTQLEELTDKPVLGVIPWLNVDIDDEDSLSERLRGSSTVCKALDIAVIRLPRLANFTDFNALGRYEQVGLRYVGKVEELGQPDLLLLPGSKNTMGDLLWLRQNGIEAAIKKLVAGGVPLFGICGGYQMLGQTLADPDGLEQGGQLRGMELLPIDTVFEAAKVRTRISGQVLPSASIFAALAGTGFAGYEIHMGRTVLRPGAEPFALLDNGCLDGAVCDVVAGSYVHGLFDEASGRELVRMLLQRKGLPDDMLQGLSPWQYKEQQYNALAAALRQSVNMEQIYRIMGL